MKIGLFIPIGNNGWVVSTTAPQCMPTFELNRSMTVRAEQGGAQDSTVSVFTRDEHGTVRHTYTARPPVSDDIRECGIDARCAVWNVLDLTPQGRGSWYAALSYDT